MSGLVRVDAQLRQACRFEGLVFGTIWPTDVDAFVDFRGRAFVFVEAKIDAAAADAMKAGQRLALERLVDAAERGGVRSLLLVVAHGTPAPRPIRLSAATVLRWRRRGRWRSGEPYVGLTVREAADAFLAEGGGAEGGGVDPEVAPAYREMTQECLGLLAERDKEIARLKESSAQMRELLAHYRREAEFV